MQTLPKPVVRYLGELELALKQTVGVSLEDALSDAREHVCRQYVELLAARPNCTDDEVIACLTESYGKPQVIADQYEAAAKPCLHKIPGYAPGWRICCTRCGRSAPAAKVGITRVAAFSIFKVVLGWCHDCHWFRWFRLTQDLDKVTLIEKLGLANSSDHVKQRHRPWWILAFVLFGIAAILIFPLVAAAQFSLFGAAKKEALFQELPPGWKLTSSTRMDAKQTAAVGKKFGFSVDSISNNRISHGEGSVQINVLRCATAKDAEKALAAFRAIHSNPRDCIRNDKIVFEYSKPVGDWQKAYAESRYRLGLQPATQTYQIECDVIPLTDGDPMVWNKLYNLFLRYESKPSPDLDLEIRELAKTYKIRDQIVLAIHSSVGRDATWKLDPPAKSKAFTSGGEAQVYHLSKKLPKRAGQPVIRISGKVKSSHAKTKMDRRNDKGLLASTQHWPVHDEAVQRLAEQITKGADSDQDKVDAILNWFGDSQKNIRFNGEVGSRYGVEKVIEQKFGHCWDYSDLCITLCRASGVPSRQVYGWLYPVAGHVWCEALIAGQWQPLDPTTGTDCGSDYLTISVSEDGTMPFVYASRVDISVVRE